VTGVVRDSVGEPVDGADVIANHVQTGLSYAVISAETGRLRSAPVVRSRPPLIGSYTGLSLISLTPGASLLHRYRQALYELDRL
jgi:hypothetical protein